MSMTSTRPQHKCGLLLLKNHSRSEIGADTSPLRVLTSTEICADPLSVSGSCEFLSFGRRAKQSSILMHIVSRFLGPLQ
eukprot:s321_g26.t1